MTPLNAVDPNAGSAPASAPVKILGKDDFLNMLIAQLQHQDPLNPADSTEFTAQLAQFSSLEQLSNIHKSLENMKQLQASLTHSQAVSYIGKEITALGNHLLLEAGQPASCRFEMKTGSAMTAVSVYDANGGFVNSFEAGALSAGQQSATWNGLDFNGNPMPPGVYKFEIQAIDSAGQKVTVTPLMTSRVSGVSLKDNTAHLITALQTVSIEDVIDISNPAPPVTAAAPDTQTHSDQQPNGGH